MQVSLSNATCRLVFSGEGQLVTLDSSEFFVWLMLRNSPIKFVMLHLGH